MRLNNYLNEDISLDDIINSIKRDCKPFLNEIKGQEKFLYRGMNNKLKIFDKLKVRQDRKPKDMSLNGHNYLDKLFLKYHGWRARSQGLFCIGTPKVPDYGITFVVFPIGNYKYLWSEEIQDLYNHTEETDMAMFNRFSYPFECLWDDDILKNEIDRYYVYEYYGNRNIISYSNVEKLLLDNAKEQLEEEIKDYNNKNIKVYLNRYFKSEIMFNCKEYYYINNNTFYKIMGEFL